MTMPNFIIIGAAKSGTTSLYHYLKQHPQIYMSSKKETEFFAFEGEQLDFRGPGDMPRSSITQLEDYKVQFQSISNELAIGEASPLYMYSPRASERIRHYIPDAKLIAILRDPIERAYSQFLMFVRDQREPLLDFAKALQEEETRISSNWAWGWHYVQVGYYYVQLRRYFDMFDRNQIKVYLYEELNNSPVRVVKDIFDFVGVDRTFVPDVSVKANISGMPKNYFLHGFLRKPNLIKDIFKPFFSAKFRKNIAQSIQSQNLLKPQITPEIRKEMLPIFREDILMLQDLIQRDLSKWLE